MDRYYKNEIFNTTKIKKTCWRLWCFVICKKFEDKYGRKLVDTVTKTGIDAAKTASKRVVQKVAEATRDLIKSKIADKITSAGKTKSKKTEDETNLHTNRKHSK